MGHYFKKHYTVDEARALLPQVRQWLDRLHQLAVYLGEQETQSQKLLARGCDLGGEPVHRWLRLRIDLNSVLREFQRRDIQIKDLARGLIDFPALLGGKEVLLCWEKGEADIEYWHDLDTGYAGRTPL